MRRVIAFFSILLTIGILSCNRTDAGFKQHPSGLSYRFYEMNPEGTTPEVGDIVVLSIRILTPEGKLFDESTYYRMQLQKPMFRGDFHTALSLLQVGDSVCFKLDAAGFFEKNRKRDLPVEFQQGDAVYIHVRIKNIVSMDEIEGERLNLYHTDRDQEQNLLKNYLDLTNTTVQPTSSGLYYIVKKEGTGKPAEPGKQLTVHYTGTTIDGKIFDSSLQRGKPFTFIVGRGQVIKGWDEGFLLMKEGGQARFIIPSDMAYGKEGYSNIILPYSTLVFEVELIEVK